MRLGKKTIGFGSNSKVEEVNQGDYLSRVLPEDLVRFGLIPEFIGRVPVIATLEPLDEEALVRILTEPKNALVKQYSAMLKLDNIDLEFTPEALREIAKKAIERKTGARGLRAIVEEIMLDVMYELPSRSDLTSCVIHEKCVTDNEAPYLKTDERIKESA